MAIGVVKLTYKQRHNLNVVFTILSAVAIFLGLLIIAASAYVYFRLAPVLYSEKSEVNFVFIVLGMYGLQVVIHYLAGTNISHKCFKHAARKSTRNLLFAWLCAGGILLLSLIMLSALSRKIAHHINRSMMYSFRYGMQNYLQEEKWKQFIDNMQYKLSCCGIESYEDWHRIPWLNKYQVNENAELAKKFANTDIKAYDVTPWSCCRIDFPLQCLHDPLQQSHSSKVWDNEPLVVADSININGCLDVLEQPIRLAINLFIVLTTLISVINVAIFVIVRLLYTSCRNALLLDDPQGLAPGWFFGRGDCGYCRGKTIYDIMITDPNYQVKGLSQKEIIEDKAEVNETIQNHVQINEQLNNEPVSDYYTFGTDELPASEGEN